MNRITRREFLKRSGGGILGAAAGTEALKSSGLEVGAVPSSTVAIIVDPNDPIANSTPALWATEQLKQSLAERQIKVGLVRNITDVPLGLQGVAATGPAQPLARQVLELSHLDLPREA